jgi:hypothetical protein
MARRGDGLYLRKHTWWLDFIHEGRRHVVRIGKNISRTVAGEIAVTKRSDPERRSWDRAEAEGLALRDGNQDLPRVDKGE